MRKPKITLFKDKKKQWRFNIKAANGKIVAVSESYKTKQGCINGYRSVVEVAQKLLTGEFQETDIIKIED